MKKQGLAPGGAGARPGRYDDEGDLRPCEAVVAEFVLGPKRCGQPATSEAMDAHWGSIHPVCDEHAPD